jgi:hypothetical protein
MSFIPFSLQRMKIFFDAKKGLRNRLQYEFTFADRSKLANMCDQRKFA